MTEDIKTAYEHEENGIKLAFFTRQGGVSPAPYYSLNCGYGSKDEEANVSMNRSRVAQYLEVKEEALLNLFQHHSDDVVLVDDLWNTKSPPKADGMVTKKRCIALSILSADCGPVLFADEEAQIIGAAHSGWRGAVKGINEKVIEAMVNIGANIENIQVYLGPMIQKNSYEVGEDVYEKVVEQWEDDDIVFTPLAAKNQLKAQEVTSFPILNQEIGAMNEGQKYLFDLPLLIERRLRRKGIEKIIETGLDTYASPNRFFSFRRNTHQNIPDYGRGISAILLT